MHMRGNASRVRAPQLHGGVAYSATTTLPEHLQRNDERGSAGSWAPKELEVVSISLRFEG